MIANSVGGICHISFNNILQMVLMRTIDSCMIKNNILDSVLELNNKNYSQINKFDHRKRFFYSNSSKNMNSNPFLEKVDDDNSPFLKNAVSTLLISPSNDFILSFYNYTNRMMVFF